jgi:hypothetical protein
MTIGAATELRTAETDIDDALCLEAAGRTADARQLFERASLALEQYVDDRPTVHASSPGDSARDLRTIRRLALRIAISGLRVVLPDIAAAAALVYCGAYAEAGEGVDLAASLGGARRGDAPSGDRTSWQALLDALQVDTPPDRIVGPLDFDDKRSRQLLAAFVDLEAAYAAAAKRAPVVYARGHSNCIAALLDLLDRFEVIGADVDATSALAADLSQRHRTAIHVAMDVSPPEAARELAAELGRQLRESHDLARPRRVTVVDREVALAFWSLLGRAREVAAGERIVALSWCLENVPWSQVAGADDAILAVTDRIAGDSDDLNAIARACRRVMRSAPESVVAALLPGSVNVHERIFRAFLESVVREQPQHERVASTVAHARIGIFGSACLSLREAGVELGALAWTVVGFYNALIRVHGAGDAFTTGACEAAAGVPGLTPLEWDAEPEWLDRADAILRVPVSARTELEDTTYPDMALDHTLHVQAFHARCAAGDRVGALIDVASTGSLSFQHRVQALRLVADGGSAAEGWSDSSDDDFVFALRGTLRCAPSQCLRLIAGAALLSTARAVDAVAGTSAALDTLLEIADEVDSLELLVDNDEYLAWPPRARFADNGECEFRHAAEELVDLLSAIEVKRGLDSSHARRLCERWLGEIDATSQDPLRRNRDRLVIEELRSRV